MPLVKLEKPEWKKVSEDLYILDMMYTEMQTKWTVFKTIDDLWLGSKESREPKFYGEWYICNNGYTPKRAWVQNIAPFSLFEECFNKMDQLVDEAFELHNNPKVVHISHLKREPVVIGGIKIE
jgi:hypothetical protein